MGSRALSKLRRLEFFRKHFSRAATHTEANIGAAEKPLRNLTVHLLM